MASNCFAASPLPLPLPLPQSTSMTQRYVCGGFCCFYCCLPLSPSPSLSPLPQKPQGVSLLFFLFSVCRFGFFLYFFFCFFSANKNCFVTSECRSQSIFLHVFIIILLSASCFLQPPATLSISLTRWATV